MRRRQLCAIVRDLANDYRNSTGEYRAKCLACIQALFKNRHTVKLDRYGWPMLPEFQQ